MQSWRQKAVKDAAKALLPFQASLRKIARSVRPYETNRLNDAWLLSDIVAQVSHLRALRIEVADRMVVEIGTGWNPLLPMLYARCGAWNVTTVDQERLLDAHTFGYAARLLESKAEDLRARGLPLRPTALDGRDLADIPLHDLLAATHIDYRAPFDVRKLPRRSADLVVSRDVLEHIPEQLLDDIIRSSFELLRPGGVFCHTIDMSDHWEHGDKSISRVNFLQHEGALWGLAGINPQNYQNRLRRFEYVRLFERAGFEILRTTGDPDDGALQALASLLPCRRYRDIDPQELAILQTTIIGRKRPR